MSRKELERKRYLEQVIEERITIKAMAEAVGICYRQAQRLTRRYRESGDAGLVHKNRGRRSNRRIKEEQRKRILSRYEERYQGYGPTFASEKLEEDGLPVDHETLRRWLIGEGQWQRQRKRGKHRKRRERKQHFGECVQIDGSHHRWMGGEESCLLTMIDDATSRRLGRMEEEETSAAAMRILWEWIKQYGIPRALYADCKNVYLTDREPTAEESLKGQPALTAFGLACHKLGITIIPSYSPQGKGRVERSHGTDQDRLVKELELAEIQTLAEANRFLKQRYYKQINRKFSVPAAQLLDYHRPVPPGVKLEEIFCWEQTRTLQKDWTVRFENQGYQILKQSDPLPRPGQKITVRRWLNGKLQLVMNGQSLPWKKAASPGGVPTPAAIPMGRRRTGHKPAADHPWRNSCLHPDGPGLAQPRRIPVSRAVAATAAPAGT